MSDDAAPKTKCAMDALDALTQEWWAESGMDAAVASIAAMVAGPFKERAFDSLVGLLKQSHTEGLYRGCCEAQAEIQRLTEELRTAREERCECGHSRSAHGGHTFVVGQREPDHCAECVTGCPHFRPITLASVSAERDALTEELRAVREERDKLQLAIEISARPIQYFMDLKAERDTLYKELELRAMLHGDCQEANEKLLADLAAEKRHWVEDDRDLNALVAERDALRQVVSESNEVCVCGCADHEDYGEDGEGCDKDHQCVRTCIAVRDMFVALRAERDALQKQLEEAQDDLKHSCVAMNEENDRHIQRIETLEAALKQYAEESNWTTAHGNCLNRFISKGQGPDLAKAALDA